MGLSARHIGKPLRAVRDELHRLEKQYGVHVCGEGGEFETLTLDCALFHKRIVLDRTESVVHSDDPFAPVVYMRCLEYHLEDKSDDDILQFQVSSSSSGFCWLSKVCVLIVIGALAGRHWRDVCASSHFADS